jgi:hypothetical protein
VGLIRELVLLPVAPVRGVVWVAGRIAEQAEQERYGEAASVQRLDQLEEARKSGELDEEKAKELEEQVIQEQLSRAADVQQEGAAERG